MIMVSFVRSFNASSQISKKSKTPDPLEFPPTP
jgi:hypothetical protein